MNCPIPIYMYQIVQGEIDLVLIMVDNIHLLYNVYMDKLVTMLIYP